MGGGGGSISPRFMPRAHTDSGKRERTRTRHVGHEDAGVALSGPAPHSHSDLMSTGTLPSITRGAVAVGLRWAQGVACDCVHPRIHTRTDEREREGERGRTREGVRDGGGQINRQIEQELDPRYLQGSLINNRVI